VLETVGVGAGAAELVDGAGAGAEVGGASVAGLDAGGAAAVWLALAGPGAAAWVPAWVPAWGVGLAVPWPPADAVARARLDRGFPEEEEEEEAEADAEAAEEFVAAGAAVLSPAVVWAGAVRANRVARPTAVTALSWVARQVRRERRRSPVARAAPGCSPGNSVVSRMTRDPSRIRVKGRPRKAQEAVAGRRNPARSEEKT